jgi:hypothetical protein
VKEIRKEKTATYRNSENACALSGQATRLGYVQPSLISPHDMPHNMPFHKSIQRFRCIGASLQHVRRLSPYY